MTNTCKLADTCIEINYINDYFARFAAGYETDEPADFAITVTQADIDTERARATEEGHTDKYLETLAIYRKICDRLAERGIVLFHSSAVAVDGKAYLFTAPSGTGKSTHARLWREVYGDHVTMINDDKPLLRITDAGATVYGTPWNGKHRLSTNTSAPVCGICILERGETNKIRRISASEALPYLMAQTYRPSDPSGAVKATELALKLAKIVPLWRLSCNMDIEAAQVSYNAMKGI